MDNITDIAERQPHIVIDASDSVHVISLAQIRDIARGNGGYDEITRLLAIIVLDNIGD